MAEKFCLKWNDFHSNASKSFGMLRNEEYLQDVTLVGDDHKQILAHKLVLSACSDYFQDIFKNNKHSHPLLCLDNANIHDLNNILDYVYNGEVQIYQEDLDRFLTIAQRLKLQGLLTDDKKEKIDEDKIQEEVNEVKLEETISRGKLSRERKISEVQNVSKDTTVAAISINQEDIAHVSEKLNEHIETCEDGSFKCKLCGKTENKRRDAMRYHIETHMEGLSYTCPICQKSFRSKNSFFVHKTRFHKS